VWLGSEQAAGAVYARFDGSMSAYRISVNNRRKGPGWGVKVLWVQQPGFNSPVTLQGKNTETGEPIWFQLSSSRSPRTSATLDPANAVGGQSLHGWTGYPSLLFFPRAGCYSLSGTWPGGSWQFGFGFGR
jgi:hypothetical protein